jgi:gamma-glutamyltranspeptidase/glutathione hydrolase
MTLEDLSQYRVLWTESLRTSFAGYEVHAHGLPAQGGIHVAEALNIATAAGLIKMGRYTESPEAFFWLSEIGKLMALSFVEPQVQSLLLGGLDGSLEARTTPAHAERLWERMKEGKFMLTQKPAEDSKHSDAVVAIDSRGNIAAMVHTINTSSWGATGIFVDGVSIPDSASFQQDLIRQTGPGKRLPDPTEPLIITKDGKPVAALASIGSGLHQKTLSVLMNQLGFGMGIKEAIDAPSLHLPKWEADGSSRPVVFAGDFSEDLLAGVRKLGMEVEVVPNTLPSRAPRGYAVGATIDPKTGRREAVATDTLNARALGQ